jgi:polyisoprenyl-teichoic acid--peptidoglycan teichoic acid transferase
VRKRLLIGGSGVVVATLVVVTVVFVSNRHPDVIVGATKSSSRTTLPGPTIALPPSTSTSSSAPPTTPPPKAVAGSDGLLQPNGHPYGDAITFTSSAPVPTDLVSVLIIGTDARPEDDVMRSNADSLHLVLVNPKTSTTTMMGIPRDSWVQIPGHGTQKINAAMKIGGPQLEADTVHKLTGLPIQYWVATGFVGFPSIIDELGGVEVNVAQRMNDHFSGARFQPGWHHFDGAQALAYARDRHDVANGDFTRSQHQGEIILATLAKLRAEVSDDAGLTRWINVVAHHVSFDAGPDQLLSLAVLARKIDPTTVSNVVVPGREGMAGSASVVFLQSQAATLFLQLRTGIAAPTP